MPTQTITLHYDGVEYRVSEWERQKIRDAIATGTSSIVEINPLDDEDTLVELFIGPGVPVHFSAFYDV